MAGRSREEEAAIRRAIAGKEAKVKTKSHSEMPGCVRSLSLCFVDESSKSFPRGVTMTQRRLAFRRRLECGFDRAKEKNGRKEIRTGKRVCVGEVGVS